MKNKTFYNKTKKILVREIKFLEMISKEHNYQLFAHHYGEKANLVTVLTKVTNLYFKVIEFEEAHPDKVKEKEEKFGISDEDYLDMKDYVRRREEDNANRAAEEAKAEALARGEEPEMIEWVDRQFILHTMPNPNYKKPKSTTEDSIDDATQDSSDNITQESSFTTTDANSSSQRPYDYYNQSYDRGPSIRQL